MKKGYWAFNALKPFFLCGLDQGLAVMKWKIQTVLLLTFLHILAKLDWALESPRICMWPASAMKEQAKALMSTCDKS
eukprot:m.58009 g.58009  ORF g.58009 m.58009 type:complete len:77 (+) comp34778_c0_seq1:380-610(+)